MEQKDGTIWSCTAYITANLLAAQIARDQEAKEGLERGEYPEDHLVFERLERYDMGEEYIIREYVYCNNL